MDLTGKCKEDFYNFITKGFKECDFARDMIINDLKFKSKTELNALIIEFFDSVGIYIENTYSESFDNSISFHVKVNKKYVNHEVKDYPINIFNSRQEATTQAIKKANEIYNNLFLPK